MNLRPEAAPTFLLPPGEGGPKGRVREKEKHFSPFMQRMFVCSMCLIKTRRMGMSRSLPETAFSSFRIFSRFLPVLLISIIAVGCGKEQEKKLTNKEIYLYQDADRDQKLIANAKKEGAVNIYTTMQEKDLFPLTEAFERRYGIKT